MLALQGPHIHTCMHTHAQTHTLTSTVAVGSTEGNSPLVVHSNTATESLPAGVEVDVGIVILRLARRCLGGIRLVSSSVGSSLVAPTGVAGYQE